MATDIGKILKLEEGRRINSIRVRKHYLQQLFWECTLKCNLKCRHCGSDCSLNDQRVDMPLKDFIPVLDEIKAHFDNPILVITTGGEPLLRKDLCECGKEITKRGFYWGIVTNGTFLKEDVLKNLLESGLNTISVSLDGLCDTHNWMRQSRKSYDDAIEAIDLIVNASSHLTWDVITCVNKRNISQLAEVKQTLIDHKVKKWKIFTVFPMGKAREDEDMMLSKEQYRELLDFIKDTRNESLIQVSYGCEGFLGPYEYEVRDNQYFCAAGVNVASILNDGSISGCLSIRYNHKQGNIYNDSFVDVWNNRFIQYRDLGWKKKGLCADCEAWRWCEGNGMHLRDDDGHLTYCNYKHLYY